MCDAYESISIIFFGSEMTSTVPGGFDFMIFA